MATLTAERTMLYCPKCQRKYEEGNQRFCNNDGGRLLPAINAGVKRENQTKGVFTNLLAKSSIRGGKDEKLAKTPRFVKAKISNPKLEIPAKSKMFTAQQDFQPKLPKLAPRVAKSREPAPTKKSAEVSKPLSRLITTHDIKVNQAELGDRKINPTGRLALTWQNPRILLGQTVKGRYYIVDKLDQDLTSIAFLAEDKMREGKKAVVRILMNQSSQNEFQGKLLSEERVSLSHVNHPNVAKVFDSGELPEGKPFIVTDHVENETVKNYLKKTGVFNPMRTARIIRQASYALSEVHQNGILHRNLQPQHLLLTISKPGNEAVQVGDFCVSNGKTTSDNFQYKSPEQINRQLATFSSDSYSLAVIAFQMLTNRMPFKGLSERELLKSQKTGLSIEASNLNPDLNPLIDEILEKALAFNPSDRYPKARDFGEAFFNAVTTAAPFDNEKNVESDVGIELNVPKGKIPIPSIPLGVSGKAKVAEELDISVKPRVISSDIHIDSNEIEIERIEESESVSFEVEDVDEVAAHRNKDGGSLWKKRSPERTNERGWLFTLISIVGLLALVVAAVWSWRYFSSLEDQLPAVAQKGDPNAENLPAQGVDSIDNSSPKIREEIESPPLPRNVETPAGFEYFENSKQKLNSQLAKKFRGFSIAYPNDWKLKKFDKNKDKIDGKFLDIAKETTDGIPIESMNISPYESKGRFSDDVKIFPELVKKSNEDLSKSLSGNYEVVSQGETSIQNGRWKAYQVNFKTKNKGEVGGKEISLWGRRLWIPVQRPGVKYGFIITMFATSLSDEIENADEVGKKGELARVLETFEPDQNY